jgi:serine/threonine-protein kinase
VTDALPRKIGRYQVEAEVGRGMMGVVYRAFDPDLGRSVALKTVRLAFVVSDAERESFEKRFLTEARAAAAVSHPGIVTVHDVGRDPETGTPYIALELLRGRSLADVMAPGEPMEWRAALKLGSRLASALQHAHAEGIVHRDVKPANIMVLPSGDPKLMDFGIAKVPAAQLTSAGESFGTPAYMSPEQACAQPVDARSDVFSLGSVLYLALTGQRPFDGPNVPAILARVAHHDPPPPSSLAAVPAQVDAILARALAKQPEARYQSARELADAIDSVLVESVLAAADGLPVATPPATGTQPPGRSMRPEPYAGVARAPSPLSWLRGRRTLVLGGLAAAAVAAAALSRSPEAVLPLVPVAPARLEVELEHPLRSGTLRVWIDDALVVEEALESRVTKKVLFVKTRKGREEKQLEVAPGEREVRVQVSGDDFDESRRQRVTFASGVTRRLNARVGGLIDRELTLVWGP